MPGLYPDEQVVNIFGTEIAWPGLDPDTHKFTNGDFNDPLKKPSFIPAETINLILDNIANLLIDAGITPDNANPNQLKNAFALKANDYAVGHVIMTIDPTSLAELYGGTWTRWGDGRVPVGVGLSDREFSEDETGGASEHTLTEAQMPWHNHSGITDTFRYLDYGQAVGFPGGIGLVPKNI